MDTFEIGYRCVETVIYIKMKGIKKIWKMSEPDKPLSVTYSITHDPVMTYVGYHDKRNVV